MHRPCSKHAWTGKKLKILIIHQKQNKNMIKFVDLHQLHEKNAQKVFVCACHVEKINKIVWCMFCLCQNFKGSCGKRLDVHQRTTYSSYFYTQRSTTRLLHPETLNINLLFFACRVLHYQHVRVRRIKSEADVLKIGAMWAAGTRNWPASSIKVSICCFKKLKFPLPFITSMKILNWNIFN